MNRNRLTASPGCSYVKGSAEGAPAWRMVSLASLACRAFVPQACPNGSDGRLPHRLPGCSSQDGDWRFPTIEPIGRRLASSGDAADLLVGAEAAEDLIREASPEQAQGLGLVVPGRE